MLEVLGTCPVCKNGKVRKGEKLHKCTKCGFSIWAEMHGYIVSDKNVVDLCTVGRTEIITFKPAGKNEFKARLIIKDKKVTYENLEKRAGGTQGRKEHKSPDEIFIRVESELSGKSSFEISSEPASLYKEISFGIISSRAAECYSLITALSYISHVIKNPGDYKVRISMNNLDFSKYLLKESAPRDKDMKNDIEFLWQLLNTFKNWSAFYKHVKKTRLEGDNFGDYPEGVFPWLESEIFEDDDEVAISLPINPAVIAQFKACFPFATQLETGFVLEVKDTDNVKRWLNTVKGVEG